MSQVNLGGRIVNVEMESEIKRQEAENRGRRQLAEYN
jgi:hypothetical protein